MADGYRFIRAPFSRMLEIVAEIEQPRIHVDRLLAKGGVLPIPPLSFGDTCLVEDDIDEQPWRGSWREEAVASGDAYAYTIDDALVHGPDGVVTIGELVIEETLAHNPLVGVQRDGAGLIFPPVPIVAEFASAHYVMGSGYKNQFHWLFEVLPRLQVAPFADGGSPGVILLPPLETQVQRDVAALCQSFGHEVFPLDGPGAVRVKRLTYVSNLSGFGFAPHVGLGPFFDRLKAALQVAGTHPRKIYISRLRTDRRRLVNEAEVCALCVVHGFEMVTLEDMDLQSQAQCFANATHIVSAHGAGLANVIFCEPGVSVCELQMDRYVHWCFRRLAGLRSINYGCVLGAADEQEPAGLDVHERTWRAPLDQLERVLTDPRFLRGPMGVDGADQSNLESR